MVLRKYLIGNFIEDINQYENERIIEIHFSGVNEIGDQENKKLIIEIMGKHSNIILLNEDKGHIIDSIKHISPYQSRYRTVLPGHSYIYPPSQNKVNPFNLDQAKIEAILNETEDMSAKTLVQHFMGISPLIAEEVVLRADDRSIQAIVNQFIKLINKTKNKEFSPVLYSDDKEDFHVMELTQFKGNKQYFKQVSELLDYFYADKAERDRVKQQVGDLTRLIKNELDKNIRKIKNKNKV